MLAERAEAEEGGGGWGRARNEAAMAPPLGYRSAEAWAGLLLSAGFAEAMPQAGVGPIGGDPIRTARTRRSSGAGGRREWGGAGASGSASSRRRNGAGKKERADIARAERVSGRAVFGRAGTA